MGLGTDHRLSLAQNPILLARQIAILLASCNRDVSRLRKRRQVAGREEVRAGDSESRAQFGRTPRAVGEGPRRVTLTHFYSLPEQYIKASLHVF